MSDPIKTTPAEMLAACALAIRRAPRFYSGHERRLIERCELYRKEFEANQKIPGISGPPQKQIENLFLAITQPIAGSNP